MAWTGFIWLRIDRSGGLWWSVRRNFELYKMQGTFFASWEIITLSGRTLLYVVSALVIRLRLWIFLIFLIFLLRSINYQNKILRTISENHPIRQILSLNICGHKKLRSLFWNFVCGCSEVQDPMWPTYCTKNTFLLLWVARTVVCLRKVWVPHYRRKNVLLTYTQRVSALSIMQQSPEGHINTKSCNQLEDRQKEKNRGHYCHRSLVHKM